MTHQLNKKIFILFIFFITSISAQKINSIKIDSGDKIPESVYSSILTEFKNKNFSLLSDSIQNRIISISLDEGFIYCKIISQEIIFNNDSTSAELNYIIQPGKPVIIKSVELLDSIEDENSKIRFLLDNQKEKIFSKKNIENISSNLFDVLDELGYLFAKIEIQNILIQENKAEIFLKLNKGNLGRVDEIRISGNESTERFVILRNLPFSIGDLVNDDLLIEARESLRKLNYFSKVDLPLLKITETGKTVIEINLKEKNTNNFDGIVGYVPKTDNEDGYFTGFVNVSLRNLFGTGRAAALRWKQFNRNSQEMELKYLEPWILDFPVSIGAQLYQKKQDTTYVKRFLKAELNYIFSNQIEAGFIFETESVIPTISDNPKFTVFNSSSISTGINFELDTRDDFLSPKEGVLIKNIYKYSSKEINGPEEFIHLAEKKKLSIQRFEIDFEYYRTISLKHTLALKLSAREIKSDLPEESDKYFLGGNNTLRGYREKQFSGTRVIWSNLEYRYFIDNKSYLFLFFDTGYFNSEDQTSVSEFLTGYGGGISLETSLGLMSISYALGKDDTFTQGKIHIGIINEF